MDIRLNNHLRSMESRRSAACQANEEDNFDFSEYEDEVETTESGGKVEFTTEEDFTRIYGSEVLSEHVGTSQSYDSNDISYSEKSDCPKVVNVEAMQRRLTQLETENIRLKKEYAFTVILNSTRQYEYIILDWTTKKFVGSAWNLATTIWKIIS